MSVFLKPPVQTYGDLIRIRFWSSNGWGLKFCIWKKLWSHADAAGLRITLSNEEPLRIFKIFLKNLSTVEYSWVQLINKVMLASNVWQRSLKEVGTSREGDAAITSLIHPFKETFSACYTHTHTHTHTHTTGTASKIQVNVCFLSFFPQLHWLKNPVRGWKQTRGGKIFKTWIRETRYDTNHNKIAVLVSEVVSSPKLIVSGKKWADDCLCIWNQLKSLPPGLVINVFCNMMIILSLYYGWKNRDQSQKIWP